MWMRSIFSRERSPTPHIPRGGAQRPPKFLGPLPTPKRFDLERRNLGTVVRDFLQAECPLCHPTDSIVAALEVVYFMSRGEQRFIHLNNEGLLMQVGGLRVKVKVRTLDTVPLREASQQKRPGMAHVLKGSQFYVHTQTFIRNRNEPYLPLPSQLWLVLFYRPRIRLRP